MNDPLQQSLSAVGLSQKQATVYLGLLKLGEATVTRLADEVDMKRPILYLILAELVELGYVTEISNQKVRRYTAGDPARLYHHVAASVENLKFVLPMLRSIRARGGPLPNIEIFETTPAITAAYRQMELSHMSRYLSSYEHMQKHFPQEVARWIRRGLDKKDTNQSRHLLTNDPASYKFAQHFKNHHRHHFHFLPNATGFPVDIAILSGTVAFTSFEPLFLVVIRSERLAETMALLFDTAWKSTVKK